MTKFKPGKSYTSRSVCDSDCMFSITVIKRTARTIAISSRNEDVKRCKIHNDADGEFVFAFGRYSMAPIFRASREGIGQ